MTIAKPFIWTRGGQRLLLHRRAPIELPRIHEIGHSLSQLNRWVGWTNYPLSVAQHSVFVSFLVRREIALHGLLHDAHECLIGDVNSPVKRWLDSSRLVRLAMNFDRDCAQLFGLRELTPAEEQELRLADLLAAHEEARLVIGVSDAELREHFGDPSDIHVAEMLSRLPAPSSVMLSEMSWREAQEAFLRRHDSLIGAPAA